VVDDWIGKPWSRLESTLLNELEVCRQEVLSGKEVPGLFDGDPMQSSDAQALGGRRGGRDDSMSALERVQAILADSNKSEGTGTGTIADGIRGDTASAVLFERAERDDNKPTITNRNDVGKERGEDETNFSFSGSYPGARSLFAHETRPLNGSTVGDFTAESVLFTFVLLKVLTSDVFTAKYQENATE